MINISRSKDVTGQLKEIINMRIMIDENGEEIPGNRAQRYYGPVA